MAKSQKVRVFLMGFVAAGVLLAVMAAATSNSQGPGRYSMETLEKPVGMVVVLDTHTGEIRYTGVGGAGGGAEVGSVEMFRELKE